MGQSGFSAARKPGKPEQGTSVAVEAVTIGLIDAALKWKYVLGLAGLSREKILARATRITLFLV